MSEELEIEFKNKLTEKEYYSLLNYYSAEDKDFFEQENHYFDTTLWELKMIQAGLRIRILENSGELTLKTPFNSHLLETTDYLTLAESKYFLLKNKIDSSGQVAKKLRELSIDPATVHLIGSLKTKRFEKQTPKGLIVLDQSFYGEKIDFELEFEVKDAMTGRIDFEALLKKHHLKEIPSQNKIVRMIKESLKTNRNQLK